MVRFPGFGNLFDWSFDRERALAPEVDIEDQEEQFLLRADLPGVDEKNIELKVENGVLTLRAEERHAAQERAEQAEADRGSKQLTRRRRARYLRGGILSRASRSDSAGRGGARLDPLRQMILRRVRWHDSTKRAPRSSCSAAAAVLSTVCRCVGRASVLSADGLTSTAGHRQTALQEMFADL